MRTPLSKTAQGTLGTIQCFSEKEELLFTSFSPGWVRGMVTVNFSRLDSDAQCCIPYVFHHDEHKKIQ